MATVAAAGAWNEPVSDAMAATKNCRKSLEAWSGTSSCNPELVASYGLQDANRAGMRIEPRAPLLLGVGEVGYK